MSLLSSTAPVASAGDDRAYRVIELPNKLRAILVSDPLTDKAAASMEVAVGQFEDPVSVPGLAHFCEHMLFLGTAKYPDESSYSAFLAAHGGSSNAYTSSEETNYHFDVQHGYLAEALDRFAQFFIAPLFTEAATARELNAVHSEHSKNLQNDSWRFYQLDKSVANPAHPLSRFGTGCHETLRDDPQRLGIDVRAALLDFHARYYSANAMTLAVYGRESLDQLEAMVAALFGALPDKQRTLDVCETPPFLPDAFQVLDVVVPIKDLRQLTLNWLLPPARSHYRVKPASMLSHLIGHEGVGSLLSALKTRGWATSLSAGTAHSFRQFSTFAVSIDLTEDGLRHCDDIAQLVFGYLDLLRSDAGSDAEWRRVYDEVARVAQMSFRFKNKEKPDNYVSKLANQLSKYPAAEVLSGPWLYCDFDVALTRQFLACLRADACRMSLVAKAVAPQCSKTEKWYGTQYETIRWTDAQARMFADVAAAQHPELHFPKTNEFIATDFTIFTPPPSSSSSEGNSMQVVGQTAQTEPAPPASSSSPSVSSPFPAPPTLLAEDAGHRLWFKLDSVFCKPKLNVIIEMQTASASTTPRHEVLTALFSQLLQDALNEYAYDAEIAGLTYSLSSTTRSLKLVLGGYNEKLPALCDVILRRMVNFEVKDDRFEIYREQYARSYQNFEKEQPYQHAMYHQSLMLESDRHHRLDKIAAVVSVTPAELRAHLPELLRSLFVDILAHGNMTAAQATEFARALQTTLAARPLHASLRPEKRMVKLAPGHCYVNTIAGYNAGDPNSAVVALWQVGSSTVANAVRVDLFSQIVNDKCYNQLRTKEQLGYLVWSGAQKDATYHAIGFRVIVQSAERPAHYLDARIEAWIESVGADLEALTAAEFDDYRAAVVAEKLERDKTLSEECSRHWRRIADGSLDFERVANEVAALRALTKADIVDFYTAFIRVGGRSRAKLSAQVFGHGHAVVEPLAAASALRAAPLATSADVAISAAVDASGSSTDAAHAIEENASAISAKAEEESPEALRATTAAAAERAASSAITVHVSNELDFRRSMPLLPSAL